MERKKMYELLGKLKDVHVMHLPQGGQMKEHGFEYWKREMLELKTLENKI